MVGDGRGELLYSIYCFVCKQLHLFTFVEIAYNFLILDMKSLDQKITWIAMGCCKSIFSY